MSPVGIVTAPGRSFNFKRESIMLDFAEMTIGDVRDFLATKVGVQLAWGVGDVDFFPCDTEDGEMDAVVAYTWDGPVTIWEDGLVEDGHTAETIRYKDGF